jgi:hypothetical protein
VLYTEPIVQTHGTPGLVINRVSQTQNAEVSVAIILINGINGHCKDGSPSNKKYHENQMACHYLKKEKQSKGVMEQKRVTIELMKWVLVTSTNRYDRLRSWAQMASWLLEYLNLQLR